MITQRPSFRSSLRVLRVSAVNNTSTAATLRARRGGAQRLHGRLDGAAPVAARGRRARYGQVQTIPDKTYQHPRPSVASVPIRVLFCHPHPLAARNRHSYGSTAGAAQHTATHNAQVLSSQFSVLGSQFSVLGSWFVVLGSRFSSPSHCVDERSESVVLYQHYVVLSFTSSTVACSRCARRTPGIDRRAVRLGARR